METILKRLKTIYNEDDSTIIFDGIKELVAKYKNRIPEIKQGLSEKDVFLITYGNSIKSDKESSLKVLHSFLNKYYKDTLSLIHILPFYPFTSDDGFSVTDFRKINTKLGNWQDIEDMSKDFRVVFDAVINHVSESSIYMEGFRKGEDKYKDFFVELEKGTDTSSVLRTRNLPLLHEYDTSSGKKWLWTTFSKDQLDLNFKNPQVLLEILDLLLFFAEKGSAMIRLDAIPYLWKELGTSCAHLPQTHEIVKIIRDLYRIVCPNVILLTETNVPHKENMSYFGNGQDESQMIYNFSLAPLTLYSIIKGNAKALSTWAKSVKKVNNTVTFLNITATHDGIGMRPTEGILPEEDREMLVNLAKDNNGAVNEKANSDGSTTPYELNINYFDALNNPNKKVDSKIEIKRFMLSQTIPLSFIGVPGIYIHSLLGSRNYTDGVKKTGRPRSINRETLNLENLEKELQEKGSRRNIVSTEYSRILEIRQKQSAFNPTSEQTILDIHDDLFVLKRNNKTTNESIIAIHNVSDKEIKIALNEFNFNSKVTDLLSNQSFANDDIIVIQAFQAMWLK